MTTLRQGDRGPAVLELQTLLLMVGHDPGPLDGAFGPRTKAAVGAYLDARYDPDDEDFAYLRALPRRPVEVPRMLTPIAAVDMRIALAAGFEVARPGAGPITAANAVRVALAQLCVEHGCKEWWAGITRELQEKRLLPAAWLCPVAGEEAYIYVWCNNIGNRQVRRDDLAGRGPLAPWFSMSPVEGSGATAHRATSAHYAYPNAAEGAAAYWRFMRDHCGSALAAFEAGDPARAAHELKVGRWAYSGDEVAYTRAMIDRGIE